MTVTTFSELNEQWPKDASGQTCRDLLVAYLTEKLLVTASSNDCNPVSAQGEAAADKVLSVLVKDIRGLMQPTPPAAPPTIKSLHRYVNPTPSPRP
jgi:hypothetical protein